MLTPEEAGTRLDTLRDESWRENARERAAKLPDEGREITEAFLATYEPEKYQEFHERRLAAGRSLDTLALEDRAAVMEALHPGLGPALTRWWADARIRPYQTGWTRTAFRVAEGHPELTAETRTSALGSLIDGAGPFDADATWLAIWGGHLLGHRADGLHDPRAVGGLLASAIDLGGPSGDETFAMLLEIGNGEHPTGMMGRHVVHALLGAARPDGWEFTGRLLLAAQRQEGLRQVILEAADEGHPDAFRHLLGIVLDNNLLRFAGAVRAAGTWGEFDGNVEDLPRVTDRVRKLAMFLGSPAERELALDGDDTEDIYTALCAGGMRDVMATLDDLHRLAAHPLPARRKVALRYASAIGLEAGEKVLASALDDADSSVATTAAWLLGTGPALPGTFDALIRLISRLPLKKQATVADRLAGALGDRPAADLLPWLPLMTVRGRAVAAWRIAREETDTSEGRAALLVLLGDRSSHVRGTALEALARLTITPEEAPSVEALLTRSEDDIRRGSLVLLAAQPVTAAKASADRLASSMNKRQRAAAGELRRRIGVDPDGVEDLRVSLPGLLTEPLPPTAAPSAASPTDDERALGILKAIDDIAHEHRNEPITVTDWQGTREILLGDARHLPWPFRGGEEAAAGMVLGEVFHRWWTDRPDALRGHDDGIDALDAQVLGRMRPDGIRHWAMVFHVTDWLLADHLSGTLIGECLARFEASLAQIPEDLSAADRYRRMRGNRWHEMLGYLLNREPGLFTPGYLGRWHRLARWMERPSLDAERWPFVGEALLAAAHPLGAATDGDLVEQFLDSSNGLFQALTKRWRSQTEAAHPTLAPIADRVRNRLVEVELRRGDLPTPTSRVTRTIRSLEGVETTVALVSALGDTAFARGWSHGASAESRDAVFSHLIRVSFPGVKETGETLRDAATRAGVPDTRLVDLALYAPQWAAAVEEALGWPGLTDGVLWLHAHTKDQQWSVEQEVRDTWAAMIAERTPLSGDDLIHGAVDVEWFRRSHEKLGENRWSALHKAARNAARGNGHRRAQMFAEAMLGQASEDELTARIAGKRNQDAVRAVGLLPLPSDPAGRQEATARRYGLLREFERGSRAFGSQRRASEGTAVRIGIENLARSAGYADPRRFIWAVEAAEAGDLADGPVTASSGDVTVTLSVTAEGTPAVSVRRGGKALRSVPAAVKKDPAIAALTGRKTALAKQATRVRDALQDAMTAQDEFTAADFEALARHPVVAPVLGRLVWVSAAGTALMREDARDLAAKAVDGPLRIAHPRDMVADGTWVHWQERLFKKELRQPFKQVFRELYVVTGAEKSSGPASRRYEGHQVQPRQALALLGVRGWVTSHESGEVSKAFHRHGYVARLSFTDGFLTPSEADLPTIDGVSFTRPGEWEAVPLDSVPPVVFSETMRDVDLVVSVAHAGGVDPEATASTVEMRAALVRETARLLKLENLSFAGSHVLIDGTLGEYSLHLGSGSVHRRPGGALCIIPVGSQHRGRLFLPFADDDPKTAEVVSKVLLLARDHQIKDPTILEQLGS